MSIIGKSVQLQRRPDPFADIPGKEFTHSESSNLINNLYHHLQDGLDLIAAGKASSLSLRPEERSPRRL